MARATASAPNDKALASRGTKTRVLMATHPRRNRPELTVRRVRSWRFAGHDLVETLRCHAAMQLAVDHQCRRAGAVAETIDRLEREAAVRGGLFEIDAEARPGVRGQRIRAHRLA